MKGGGPFVTCRLNSRSTLFPTSLAMMRVNKGYPSDKLDDVHEDNVVGRMFLDFVEPSGQ